MKQKKCLTWECVRKQIGIPPTFIQTEKTTKATDVKDWKSK